MMHAAVGPLLPGSYEDEHPSRCFTAIHISLQAVLSWRILVKENVGTSSTSYGEDGSHSA